MSLSDTMTALMDKARKLTGLTDKISVTQLTNLMDHFDLHVNPDLLGNAGITFAGDNVLISNPNNVIEEDGDKVYMTTELWNQIMFLVTLDPGTYTYSASLMNPLVSDGAIFFVQGSNGSPELIWVQIAFAEDNKWHRCQYTFSIKTKSTYRVFFTNANKQKNMKLEVGDLATPLKPLAEGSN